MRASRVFAIAILAGAAVTLSACDLRGLGADRARIVRTAGPVTVTVSAPPPTPAAAAAAQPKIIPAAPILLTTRKVTRFGTIAVDARGHSLYRSDADSAHPPTSRCTGACLAKWHPALVPNAHPRVTGVDARLVGTLALSGGRRQLTLAGWPLYTFVGDARAGQVNGQCRLSFSVVDPAGRKIIMSPAPAS